MIPSDEVLNTRSLLQLIFTHHFAMLVAGNDGLKVRRAMRCPSSMLKYSSSKVLDPHNAAVLHIDASAADSGSNTTGIRAYFAIL